MIQAQNDEKNSILKYLDCKNIYYIFIATRGNKSVFYDYILRYIMASQAVILYL